MRWRSELSELLTLDAAGLHSILERRYHLDVERRHGLPAGDRQRSYRRDGHNEYRDVFYGAYLTAVELDGRLAHPSENRWADIERDNAAAADGIYTLRYGYLDLTLTPCQVAAQVATVLSRRGFTGARRCCPDCAVTPMQAPAASRPAQARTVSPGRRAGRKGAITPSAAPSRQGSARLYRPGGATRPASPADRTPARGHPAPRGQPGAPRLGCPGSAG